MEIKEQKEKIREIIKILSKNQKDIKYILKKYNEQSLLTIFDVIHSKYKEVITALIYLLKYIHIDDFVENRDYNIPFYNKNLKRIRYHFKYISRDIVDDYKKNIREGNIETFFFNLHKYYSFKIIFKESFVSLNYSPDSKYTNLKEIAYIIDLLIVKYGLKNGDWWNSPQIDTENDEKKFQNMFLREYKLQRIIDETN